MDDLTRQHLELARAALARIALSDDIDHARRVARRVHREIAASDPDAAGLIPVETGAVSDTDHVGGFEQRADEAPAQVDGSGLRAFARKK